MSDKSSVKSRRAILAKEELDSRQAYNVIQEVLVRIDIVS